MSEQLAMTGGGEPRLTGSRDELAAFHHWFEVVLADTPALLAEVHALRYQVYCVEHAFEDPAEHMLGCERDAYDDRSVHALLRHRPTGSFAGTVRLVLPDTGSGSAPFPIEENCASALSVHARTMLGRYPRSRTAEISRFAVSKAFRRRLGEAESASGVSDVTVYSDGRASPDGLPLRRAMPFITLGLLTAVFRLSIRHDVGLWLAVMEPALLRLLSRFAVRFHSAGDAVAYHGWRQPALARPAVIERHVRRVRPDMWRLISDGGRLLPRSP